ncbi:uncharacterized protein LOC128989577 [Macrosteles quadrilineatus]|uniref:uncharacterized protein LOC128989577 n=1 Tax=Macrosteles quadrilineatus TaxID=74068 RepID=UPI0023E33F97|nr:uncharacterized protein LOC128989577 [Macrosteles quadrilineatus]
MPRNLSSSAFMKPFVVLALPGMYLFYKYSQYKRQQQEQNRRRVTERELAHLNHKIDKLLTKLEENEPELATSQEDECVICVNAKATMQTSPCGHRVVCRKCFVKTIQMAVSQRLLPLRCVICRAKILRLKQSSSQSWVLPSSASGYSVGGKTWVVPSSASQYHMAVPNSESLYSMASGSSSLSGVSSVSSATNSSSGSSGHGDKYDKYRYPRQPISGSLRKSQTQSMKYRLQEYKEVPRGEPQEKPRLPPIQEFQREYRAGKERSTSTRIRCAQKIVTQLETTPLVSNNNKNKTYFRSPLKPTNKEPERKKPPIVIQKPKVKEERHKEEKTSDNKKNNEENIDRDPTTSTRDDKSKKIDKKEKKEEKKENKKEVKQEKPKEEKKELTKAEKKEIKKEAKAEKKNAKKEAKLEAKKEKNEKKEKSDKKEKKEESVKK